MRPFMEQLARNCTEFVGRLAFALDYREETDPHDACFAVYTSGTTGNPKGALHEYGKIEMVIDSYHVEPDFAYDDTVQFLYQKDVFSLGKYIECELNHLPSGEQPWPFFVASVVDDAEEEMLRLCVICSPERFSEAKVEKFQQLYLEAVAYLSEG